MTWVIHNVRKIGAPARKGREITGAKAAGLDRLFRGVNGAVNMLSLQPCCRISQHCCAVHGVDGLLIEADHTLGALVPEGPDRKMRVFPQEAERRHYVTELGLVYDGGNRHKARMFHAVPKLGLPFGGFLPTFEEVELFGHWVVPFRLDGVLRHSLHVTRCRVGRQRPIERSEIGEARKCRLPA